MLVDKAIGIRHKEEGVAYLYLPEYHTVLKSDIKQDEYVKEYSNIEVDLDATVDPKILEGFYDFMEHGEISKVPSLGFCIITNKCNMGCTFCYADKNTDTCGEKFKPEWVDYLKTILPESSFIDSTVSGGEPFLEFKMVKELRSKFKRMKIYTNGALITEEIVKWLIETNTRIYVALDYEIEGFDGHDTVGVRDSLEKLCEKFPDFKPLLEIAITYPIGEIGNLGEFQNEQERIFEHGLDHDFNFVEQGEVPTAEDFAEEVRRIESGECKMPNSIFKRQFKYLAFAKDKYVNTQSCSPSINVNFRGDVHLCQVRASNTTREGYEKDVICHVEDFSLEKYYEKAFTSKRRGLCKADCPCKFLCAHICWSNLDSDSFQCKLTRNALFYAMYLILNYSDLDMQEAFNINRIGLA